jgi:hypothetical protein
MRLLRDSPRWLFLAALVYAPWAYGCTTAETIVGLNWILGAALGLWIINLLVSRRRPFVPLPLLIVTLVLLAIGWWMVLNARWIYDSEYSVFIPIKRPFPRAPGSVDLVISAAWMWRATTLLLASWFVADLSQRPIWLLRLWWTIAGTGASIAFLGLLQKGSGAEMIFWQPSWSGANTNFFATYYYHANSGAFLNLVLPPVAGLAIRSVAKREKPITVAIWLSATLIVLIAILANTSRMAQAIGILLLLALSLGPARTLLHVAKRAEKFTLVTGAIVIVITIAAIAQASRLDQPLERWNQLMPRISQDARWLVAVASLPAVRDAGFFGFGPGTFRVVFRHYTGDVNDRIRGVWRFLHQDYLQTLLEWGWIGSALWATLFFGGIAVALRNLHSANASKWSPRYRVLLALSVLALAGVALHAFVDFPFQIASLQLYVATYLGICWSSVNWKSGNAESGAFG